MLYILYLFIFKIYVLYILSFIYIQFNTDLNSFFTISFHIPRLWVQYVSLWSSKAKSQHKWSYSNKRELEHYCQGHTIMVCSRFFSKQMCPFFVEL